MKLIAKNLRWIAGRPIVVMSHRTAKKLNVFVNDRVLVKNHQEIHAVVDILEGFLKEGEVGLSQEISKYLRVKNGEELQVEPGEHSYASIFIKKKIEGGELTSKEIQTIIEAVVDNKLTEAEIAYFTAAEKIKGMSFKETLALTRAMVKTGDRLNFGNKKVADKHCVGGIAGNRTTPIVVAICVAGGLTMPKTSSRAITSAAGTADVIETISKVEFGSAKLKKIVLKTGGALAWGGSLNLSPSDDKIIRVERLLKLDIEPQLLSSIMSKKIAAGSKYIVIDIPFGKGAKIATKKSAEDLGKKFVRLGKAFKIKVKPIYTDGSQPIGNGVGPILELFDVVKVLKNDPASPQDLREKALHLASELMSLCGIKNAKAKAEEILNSGKAFNKFKEIINEQNGSKNFDEKVDALKLAKYSKKVRSKITGRIVEIDNKGINNLARIMGNPESKGAGIYLHKHKGIVQKGELVMTMYSDSRKRLREARKVLKEYPPIKIVSN